MDHLGENSLIHKAPAERISFIYVFRKKKKKKKKTAKEFGAEQRYYKTESDRKTLGDFAIQTQQAQR